MKKINFLIYIIIITTNLMNFSNDKKEKILDCIDNEKDIIKILKFLTISIGLAELISFCERNK